MNSPTLQTWLAVTKERNTVHICILVFTKNCSDRYGMIDLTIVEIGLHRSDVDQRHARQRVERLRGGRSNEGAVISDVEAVFSIR